MAQNEYNRNEKFAPLHEIKWKWFKSMAPLFSIHKTLITQKSHPDNSNNGTKYEHKNDTKISSTGH